jgi:hypothetical protein
VTGPSSNWQAVYRLHAAGALITSDVVGPLTQVATHLEVVTQLISAAVDNLVVADGHVQQAVGATEIAATLVVLNTQLEELLDHVTAGQAAMDGSADLCAGAVLKIQDRIVSLNRFGG